MSIKTNIVVLVLSIILLSIIHLRVNKSRSNTDESMRIAHLCEDNLLTNIIGEKKMPYDKYSIPGIKEILKDFPTPLSPKIKNMIKYGRSTMAKIEKKWDEGEEVVLINGEKPTGDQEEMVLKIAEEMETGDVKELYQPVHQYRLEFIRVAQRNLLPINTAYELYIRGYLQHPGKEFTKYEKEEIDLKRKQMKDDPESVETIKMPKIVLKNGYPAPSDGEFIEIPKIGQLDVARKYLYKGFKGDWDNWEKIKGEDIFRCSACEEMLPRSDFYYEKGRANGVSGYCKNCRRKIQKKKYEEKKTGEKNTAEKGKPDRSWRAELKSGRKLEDTRREYLQEQKEKYEPECDEEEYIRDEQYGGIEANIAAMGLNEEIEKEQKVKDIEVEILL